MEQRAAAATMTGSDGLVPRPTCVRICEREREELSSWLMRDLVV